MEAPIQSNMLATKRILRYVKGTQGDGIFYPINCQVELVGYIDNDWGDDVERSKSILRYAFHIGCGAISWSSKKQQVVALLSTEPKYNAATNCATYSGSMVAPITWCSPS